MLRRCKHSKKTFERAKKMREKEICDKIWYCAKIKLIKSVSKKLINEITELIILV